MLYPQSNRFRQTIDLSGFWDFRFDPENIGLQSGFPEGVNDASPIAVPASWNDQFTDWRDYLGAAWYQTRFTLPWAWENYQVTLRFGSVNYLAEVWLNGTRIGEHEGGHLPFTFDVTPHLLPDNNLLVVRVDGELAPDRVPPGNIPRDQTSREDETTPFPTGPFGAFPDTAFDFFPFCGIHRPVLLSAIPHGGIQDLTVFTDVQDQRAVLRVQWDTPSSAKARFTLTGHGTYSTTEFSPGEDAHIEVQNPALWSPEAPNLYDLTVELLNDGKSYDRYSLPVGIRTISIDGDVLLLNGTPITLNGFGRHEDFPVTGRGLLPALIVKDYSLMKWIGANSFRTSHYPYSEQMLDLADRLGFLVIDETPAAGLFFRQEDLLEKRTALCRQYVRELIDRDKNHPSVILWNLANEPDDSTLPVAKKTFRELYKQAKSLDPSRPVTIVSYLGAEEESLEFCDVVCLNRYRGWYTQMGRLKDAGKLLSDELDQVHEKFPKPLILTEFGADTEPGHHAIPPEMFSEEYQAEMLTTYIDVLNRKKFVVGRHVWNMCDFKVGQAVHRFRGMNLKGVFTRDRRPKLAAYRLREIWRGCRGLE